MKNSTAIAFGLGILIFIMVACNQTQEPAIVKDHVLRVDSKNYDQRYEEYTLDGCQYIVAGTGIDRWGSHKGTCTNPKHKNFGCPCDTIQ